MLPPSMARAVPTAEEAAAITAAIEVLWPRPAAPTAPLPTSPWRFSGRTWAKPVLARRQRPW